MTDEQHPNARLDEVQGRTHYILKRLKDLIELGRGTFYLPEYRGGVSEDEILGVIVAKYCEWTGSRIVKVSVEALEDANYHGLSAQVEDLWEHTRKAEELEK